MTATTTDRTAGADASVQQILAIPRITYVAYPSSLVLRSANAVQTYATVRALRTMVPMFEVIIPRFARRPSAFADLDATHLLRIPLNAGRHLLQSSVWSYAERTWFAFRVLARLLRQRTMRVQPNVLYVRDIVCATWFALLARRIAGTKVIFEVHDREAENRSANSGPVARRMARWMDRIALARADGLVSLTDTFLRTVQENIAASTNVPVAVIPDAFDDAVYAPRDKASARATLSIPDSAFVVVYSGLTFAYHGVDTLVAAFAAFAAETPDALLILVGGRDSERRAIAADVAARGMTDRVRVVPPQPAAKIPRYLAAANALAIPDTVTKASASPLKLFEYAAMGQPIVAVDLPALREILPEDAAVYIPAATPAAIAEGFMWVQAHPIEAEVRGKRARDAVASFTYAARARAIVDICQRVHEARR